MKKLLYTILALISINLYAGDNPFDLEKNMGSLDNDEDSLFDDLDTNKPIKVNTSLNTKKPTLPKKPILVTKPIEIKKPILVPKPVEVKKPILVPKPIQIKKPTLVKSPKQIKAEQIAKEKAEIEAYEKKRKAIIAKKKADRLKLEQAKKDAQIKTTTNKDTTAESFDDILIDTKKDVVKPHKVKKYKTKKHTKKKHHKNKKKRVRKHKKTINPPVTDKDEINLAKEAKERKEQIDKAYEDAVREMSQDD